MLEKHPESKHGMFKKGKNAGKIVEESPMELEKLLDTIVSVSVKDGRRFRGKLTGYDAYMNLILKDAEEFSNDEQTSKHKLLLLKGGNISSIST